METIGRLDPVHVDADERKHVDRSRSATDGEENPHSCNDRESAFRCFDRGVLFSHLLATKQNIHSYEMT
jgi:hypothetical protein